MLKKIHTQSRDILKCKIGFMDEKKKYKNGEIWQEKKNRNYNTLTTRTTDANLLTLVAK